MKEDKPSVVIVDYDMGNLFSLQKVVGYLGGMVVVSGEASVIMSAPRLILPGVGAFGDGMRNLKDKNLIAAIKNFVDSRRPLLGICLGAQLFMNESEEHGRHEGLNLIPGRVVRFREPQPAGPFFKIPHVGWNSVHHPINRSQNGAWDKTIFCSISEGSYVYFVHSYRVVPDDESAILSETEYGRDRFCSALHKDNIWGCQFHPEISGPVGLNILKEFLFNT